MDQYRTSGVIDEAAMKEIIGIFIPTWYRWLTGTCCVLSLLMSLFMGIGVKKVGFACVFLFFSALLASYPALHRRRYLKMTLARTKEQTGSPSLSLPMESFFNVEGLVVHNPKTDASALLRYDDIAFVRKSKRYFTVMTRGQQFSLVFKDCLTDEQQKSFMSDLKQRCPKIKVRR